MKIRLKSFISKLLIMIGSNSVHSRGRLIYKGLPVKSYPFSNDFGRIYGTTEEVLREIVSSISKNPRVIGNPVSGRPYMYGLSFPWGYMEHGGPVRKVDFYGFEFDRDWEVCNPEWEPYIFRDGVLQPDDTKGCGTGLILLGREEDLRRVIVADGGDLERYLHEWVELGELGPIDPKITHLEIKD